ncbi:TPA: ABC transporter permease/substrate binding protein [Streptococcus pyogenes]|uniref:L-proline Glycine Betaine ABC transport system permease protein proW n=1 Tax=Streptococcus pyogenes serotype M49 (strain NZ131) TaxID=471876 RepID=A0A0H3BYX3_STRPZ|nr:ABC transporter permease/substrate binding protein [Streptococcus pyogenes]HER4683671.1 ABC transporter permease/substrate binding protein [Streptococcus pyogenes NGAS358]HER4694175.1 ABC transporter permease/substrate binding protein [Streptococcus pyogenes NGAS367]ACI60511.1 L-proline Glycine Betaine ABC transport system permease protein proW [Streptococcus pyogenes NZ131]MCX2500725.1 ABC transporter permease/substrate binding protein [Streptococcus pyogenes]MCX2508865.1 ABC transporter p
METILQTKLPVAQLVEQLTEWLTKTFSGLFDIMQVVGSFLMDWMTKTLLFIHPLLFIVLVTAGMFFLAKKKWPLPTFTLLGLLFIYNQGLWKQLMNTFTLVLVASLISVLIGIPLGIWMAKNATVRQIVNPILDFMQTMPAFVYLIPAVAFFGIGMVPGVFASVIFALPPTVRFTNLAIRDIPTELIEASDAFGSTGKQKLFKVELPLAKNTIMAGVNQTMMLALSMVVTGSMIGAPGLGREVLSALQHADIGSGFVSGLALVILAIVLDRMTQLFNSKPQEKAKAGKTNKWIGLAALAVFLIAALGRGIMAMTSGMADKGETVNIAYVQWDSEVASTHVIAEVLKNEGYHVTLTPLDNAVMWQTVANGNADFSTSAWLPVTHGQQYQKYKSKLDDLGPNLKGTKLGLAVPKYMTDVNSIEDLSKQADQKITGIEPGAGIMAAAQKTLKEYHNLSSWELVAASTGAMTTSLDQAIKKKDPIVVTAWSPHWMFAKYDLKYLKDPKETFGSTENINTIARKGLKKDLPNVYKIIVKFHWTQKDMEAVMLDINKGMSPEAAAKKWVEANKSKVSSWTK